MKKTSLFFCLLLFSVVLMSSCQEKEEDKTVNSYSYGFSSINDNGLGVAKDEVKIIEDAFTDGFMKSGLAANATNSFFTLTGDTENCNSTVRNTCENVHRSLKAKQWKGNYQYEVTHVKSKKIVFQCNIP